MKFLFNSDRFNYIHPSLQPRLISEYSQKELDEAIANTKKIWYSVNLLNDAIMRTDKRIPTTQRGALIVFPYLSPEGFTEDEVKNYQNNLKNFIFENFKSVNDELKGEYSDNSDTTDYYEIDNCGKYFEATFNYECGKTKDSFNPKSISLYLAGCKDTTARYIFEVMLDRCFTESDKNDKNVTKTDKDKTEKTMFELMRSFLVFDFNNRQFYQIGVKENELYRKPQKSTKPNGYDVIETKFVYSQDEPFD